MTGPGTAGGHRSEREDWEGYRSAVGRFHDEFPGCGLHEVNLLAFLSAPRKSLSVQPPIRSARMSAATAWTAGMSSTGRTRVDRRAGQWCRLGCPRRGSPASPVLSAADACARRSDSRTVRGARTRDRSRAPERLSGGPVRRRAIGCHLGQPVSGRGGQLRPPEGIHPRLQHRGRVLCVQRICHDLPTARGPWLHRGASGRRQGPRTFARSGAPSHHRVRRIGTRGLSRALRLPPKSPPVDRPRGTTLRHEGCLGPPRRSSPRHRCPCRYPSPTTRGTS